MTTGVLTAQLQLDAAEHRARLTGSAHALVVRATTVLAAAALNAAHLHSAAAAAEKTYSVGTDFAQEGTFPHGALLRDPGGALYGATPLSGGYGNGAIFKLTHPRPANPG